MVLPVPGLVCSVRGAIAPLWATSEWHGGAEIRVWKLIPGGAGFERSVWRVCGPYLLGLAWAGRVGWESPGGKKLGVLGVGASWSQVGLQGGGPYSE